MFRNVYLLHTDVTMNRQTVEVWNALFAMMQSGQYSHAMIDHSHLGTLLTSQILSVHSPVT